MVELYNLYTLSVIIFSVAYLSLIVFIFYQILTKEKIARPFLIAMMIYFALDLVGIIFLFLFNFYMDFGTNLDPSRQRDYILASLYLYSFLLFMVSPLYLIYNLEYIIVKKTLIKEKHIFTILQIILVIILVIASITVPNVVFAFIIYSIVSFIQVTFFIAGFLYVGIKSTGRYRINSFVVLFGYV